MGYFRRFSYLPPPSPTPSHASSIYSSTSETNTITTTASDTASVHSRTFFSVIRASIAFPLSNQKTPESVTLAVPPSPTLLSPIPKDDNNGLIGLACHVDATTATTTTTTTTTTPFATTTDTKNNNDDILASKQPCMSNTEEYETMPLKRRQEALARVNKLRIWLNLPERSLMW